MNYMKLNTDKCHLLISGNRNEYMWAKLDEDIVCESNDLELLGVTIDNNLRFDKHVCIQYLFKSKQEVKRVNKSS